jgi:hypothetical protein
MMDEEWGPWIEHDGKGCPCVGKYAHWVFDGHSAREGSPRCHLINGGKECVGFPAGGPSWFWNSPYLHVIRYRIRRPKALRELIDMVENLPVREDA